MVLYGIQWQYIPRNMHTVFALLCFVVVIHWLIVPYPSGLLHWHCGNVTIAPVPAKQPWWIWINTSCEFILNDCITTTKQSTTKPCANFLGYTVLIKFHCSSVSFLLILIHLLDSNAESDDVIMDKILIGSHEHKHLPQHSRVRKWPFLCIHNIHKRHPMAFPQGLEWVFLAATKQL